MQRQPVAAGTHFLYKPQDTQNGRLLASLCYLTWPVQTVQSFHITGCLHQESFSLGGTNGFCLGQFYGSRVPVNAIEQEFVV